QGLHVRGVRPPWTRGTGPGRGRGPRPQVRVFIRCRRCTGRRQGVVPGQVGRRGSDPCRGNRPCHHPALMGVRPRGPCPQPVRRLLPVVAVRPGGGRRPAAPPTRVRGGRGRCLRPGREAGGA